MLQIQFWIHPQLHSEMCRIILQNIYCYRGARSLLRDMTIRRELRRARRPPRNDRPRGRQRSPRCSRRQTDGRSDRGCE